ncbi:nuclear factor related to kappa-B-binding protein [Anabrus simplex]|uniref:nuclear factor related to kappa-B-binding protein n=1 Tax=Anabrus simplex TaxID=316456 RepID=UPI0035A26945
MEPEYSTLSSESSMVSSETSHESTRLEECRIEGVDLKLPQGLCENKDIFREFFSMQMWQECLTEQQRQHLKNFLPTFPENDNKEKDHTLKMLFNRENMRFGAPLTDFQTQLKNGYHRPEIARMRFLMRKALVRDYKHQQRKYYYRLTKEILLSRQRLLETAYNQQPGTLVKMERIPNPATRAPQAELRARRRYFEELAAIRQEVQEEEHSSEDDNYPEGPPQRLNKKTKRHLAILESSLSPNLKQVTSTMALKPSGIDLESNVTNTHNPYEITEEIYRNLLLRHRKRRLDGDTHPVLNTVGVTMQDVEARAQIIDLPAPCEIRSVMRFMSARNLSVADIHQQICKVYVASAMSEDKVHISSPRNSKPIRNLVPQRKIKIEVEDDVSDSYSTVSGTIVVTSAAPTINTTISTPTSTPNSFTLPSNNQQFQQHLTNTHQHSTPTTTAATPVTTTSITTTMGGRHLNAATLSDLDGIDMMNLPVDLDETPHDPMDINLDDIKPTPELMQETHACFFSLIRDVICSTPEHRMNLATIEDRLKAWQENPISPLNDWYCIAADSWVLLLSSAVDFLCGNYPDAQPEEFVPYLEYKVHLQVYQWIGAGRDSDGHLTPLCQYWLDHRDEMRTRPPKDDGDGDDDGIGEGVGGDERALSPPPPRFPTTWSVRPSGPEEKELFQEQERIRYENPHRAFTYRMHGYESVVGPVKGVYNQSVGVNKPRGHSLLVADRPNFVTILALVRDATARLPNGEGTRSDICELLKDSQYLAPIAQESYLHSVVSGALDRLHYETDPCVKYDTKRKIWIYLHRGRSEEEFERIHQQQQGMAKTKKTSGTRKQARAKQQREAAAVKEITQVKLETPGASPTTPTATIPARPAAATIVKPVPSPTLPGQAAAKPAVAGVPRVARVNPSLARSLSLAGQTVQNLQVSSASGLQTIQVTTSPSLLGGGVPSGKSLLTTQTPVSSSSIPVGASLVKTVTLNAQGQANVATSVAGTVMKTVTLTPQQMQAVQTARNMVAANARDSTATVKAIVTSGGIQQGTTTLRMPLSAASLIGSIASPITSTAQPADKTLTTMTTNVRVSTPSSLQQTPMVQKVTTAQSRPTSIPSPRNLANAVVNVSQVQLVGSRSPQSIVTGKTLGLSGVKLVNAVKAVSSSDASQQQQQQQQQQQTIYIKQQSQNQQQQQQQKQQQQNQLLQQQAKQAAAIAQLQQQLQQQQLKQQLQQHQQQLQQQLKQQQQQQQQQSVVGTTVAHSVQQQQPQQRLVTTMSVLNQGQGQQRIVTRVGGKPIPVSHVALSALQQQQQQQQQGNTASTAGATTVTSTATVVKQQQQPPPMVAKVLTNAQGQVISMESLLAHQKQHGTLPQGTALRVTTTGGKPGQTSLIQIPSTTPGGVAQFAVVSQGNLLSVGQPRVLQTHLPATQQGQLITSAGLQQHAVVQQQQAQATKLVNAGTATTTNLRMLTPGTAAGSLNLAHIGGKPVLLASKAQPLQGTGAPAGQNVILTSQAPGGQQTVVLASQALRAQGGTLVLQQGGTQQILLPPGFQGGTLNIKTLQGLQGLQGLKVIPLSQATAAAGKGRQQVYARIISPGLRPTTPGLVQQNATSAATTNVTLQGTATTEAFISPSTSNTTSQVGGVTGPSNNQNSDL